MKDYMIKQGIEKMEVVEKYGLKKYYDKFTGHIIIEMCELNDDLQEKAFNFVKANSEWILGFEEVGGVKCMYIIEIDNLQ